jgi:3',5'-cyclic AMP phosphodiesterase CpdA
MKILHFSDIHTGGKISSLKSLFDKRIIGTLNYTFRRKRHVFWDRLERAIDIINTEKPDIVINTGDITSVSEPGEFDEALDRLKAITENNDFTFLNVPGNHDYYINNNELLTYRNNSYNTLNRGKFPLEKFPCRLQTKHIDFIMIDESRPNSGTQSSGHAKMADIETITKWTEEADDKKVILVGHYPLRNRLGQALDERRALENSDLLYDLLEKGRIAINLCGHVHAAFVREEASGSKEICAGSLTIGGRMNKLEYDSSSGEFCHSWIELK